MHRDLAAGPIVWLGIIVATCLLLVLFQTILWLVLPFMLAIVANYVLSPLVDAGIRNGMTRARGLDRHHSADFGAVPFWGRP